LLHYGWTVLLPLSRLLRSFENIDHFANGLRVESEIVVAGVFLEFQNRITSIGVGITSVSLDVCAITGLVQVFVNFLDVYLIDFGMRPEGQKHSDTERYDGTNFLHEASPSLAGCGGGTWP
jgi:hypothetical protein